MEIEEIKTKMQDGDMKTAASAIGISRENASQALRRLNSKYHDAIKNMLEKVITMRETLIAGSSTDTENFQ